MPIIMICIGLLLIAYSSNAIKKQKNLENENNNSLFNNVLSENEKNADSYKYDLVLLRKDMAESLTELQEEIIEIKRNLNMVKEEEENIDNSDDIESKSKIIKKMLEEGMSDEDICKKLSIGKGEVLLVKGLYK